MTGVGLSIPGGWPVSVRLLTAHLDEPLEACVRLPLCGIQRHLVSWVPCDVLIRAMVLFHFSERPLVVLAEHFVCAQEALERVSVKHNLPLSDSVLHSCKLALAALMVPSIAVTPGGGVPELLNDRFVCKRLLQLRATRIT